MNTHGVIIPTKFAKRKADAIEIDSTIRNYDRYDYVNSFAHFLTYFLVCQEPLKSMKRLEEET